MSHKVLIVYGSPRQNGNSSMLADEFARGVREAGCEVFCINVGRAKIGGCLGCEYCFSHEGTCCQKDDMKAIYPLLRTCDTLVYATPVYCFTFTSQIKAFMDRMFCGIAKPFAIKSTALLTVCEDKDASILQHIIGTYRALASYSGWTDKGVVAVHNVYKKGDIEGNPKLEDAYALGALVAQDN